jgi:hypothetical protein
MVVNRRKNPGVMLAMRPGERGAPLVGLRSGVVEDDVGKGTSQVNKVVGLVCCARREKVGKRK